MAVKISGLPELTNLDGTEIIPLVSGNITKQITFNKIKQNILNDVPSSGGSSWSDISNKPFETIGSGLTVIGGVLSASGLDFTALSGMIVQGTNMSIITDSNAKTITFNATGGIDFDALAVAMTTGTQSGITVTADTENSRFNFEVTGIPTIAIDSEGYWTINGDRGTNPTKAQGEKGADGISPTANVTATENGATITIIDRSGTTTVDISNGTNGANGISPHIDNITNHWFVGETDTGVNATAAIDDMSADGTDVTWSASKINSLIGDINTILASVTGGIA